MAFMVLKYAGGFPGCVLNRDGSLHYGSEQQQPAWFSTMRRLRYQASVPGLEPVESPPSMIQSFMLFYRMFNRRSGRCQVIEERGAGHMHSAGWQREPMLQPPLISYMNTVHTKRHIDRIGLARGHPEQSPVFPNTTVKS